MWIQVYTEVSVETIWLLSLWGRSECRPGVLRRIRVLAGLLNIGVVPSHFIIRLVVVKGYECITVFHNQISSLSVICGWGCADFLEFLSILFLYLVTTCGCDLGTLYLNDLVWVVSWLGLGLTLEQQDLDIDLYVVVLNIHFSIHVGLLLCFCLDISLTQLGVMYWNL